MKMRLIHWNTLAILFALALILMACGGSTNNSDSSQAAQPTATRRAQNLTRTPAPSAESTQDPLDDSANNSNPDETPGNSAAPTQDVLDDSSASSNNASGQTTPGPRVRNGQVVLARTVWLLADEGRYKFCPSGEWKFIKGVNAVLQSGTFEVDGDVLNLQNGADNQTTIYRMMWKPTENILELKADAATLNLQFDGKADCSE